MLAVGKKNRADETNTDSIAPVVVYYDGSCPWCTREINSYRRAQSLGPIEWVDASHADFDECSAGLSQEAALTRLHVRAADGELRAGVDAFRYLWSRLPALDTLLKLTERKWTHGLLEFGYGLFVASRGRDVVDRARFRRLPRWLRRELRADHAGELGAVHFYRTVLWFTKDPHTRNFAEKHLATERQHLQMMESLVPPRHRSALRHLWVAAAWLLGVLASAGGNRGVYATVYGIERFVERHYWSQINRIQRASNHPDVLDALAQCCADEMAHRFEARAAFGPINSTMVKAWHAVLAHGSAAAVLLARYV